LQSSNPHGRRRSRSKKLPAIDASLLFHESLSVEHVLRSANRRYPGSHYSRSRTRTGLHRPRKLVLLRPLDGLD
jgi:hypothetical protein